MDRRIVKTRQNLHQALLSLLREQPFEHIEIQAITDRANTARVTFYRHYGTKEELLLDVLAEIYRDLQAEFQFVSLAEVLDIRQPPPVIALFNFIEQDRVLYKKLLTGTICALIQQRIRQYIVQEVNRIFAASPRHAEMPVELIANQIASVTIGSIMWWLTDDLPYSGEQMAYISHRMVLSGVTGLLERGQNIFVPMSPDS